MDLNNVSSRKLKNELIKIWETDDFEVSINEYIRTIPQKLLSPMFSALCHSNEKVKWNSIKTFTLLSKYYIINDRTKAREMIRRCIWMLGEESGNIPWGISEALAATVVAEADLVDEFAEICLSYIYESDEFETNYLDHPPLRTGAYWGVNRIVEEYPNVFFNSEKIFIDLIDKEDIPIILSYLYFIMKNSGFRIPDKLFSKLRDHGNSVKIHINGKYLSFDIRAEIEN